LSWITGNVSCITGNVRRASWSAKTAERWYWEGLLRRRMYRHGNSPQCFRTDILIHKIYLCAFV
jgi:hypothetical protein